MSINRKQTKIIFMGTPDFSVPCLKSLINEAKVIAVVTQPDKKVGRKQEIIPSPIKQFALKNSLEVFQPAKLKGNTEFINQLKKYEPDLIIVVAYGLLLPQEILSIPKFGVINVHASLLPKYRGASPIQTAILNGDKETGVTIMLLDDKMDHGALLAQKTITLTDNDNFTSLHDKLAQLGADLLIDTLPKYLNNELKPIPQDESKATYCQLIKKEDGKIDWNKPAEDIERQVRAFTPWPGAFTDWNGKQVKFIKSKVIELQNHKEGEIFKINDGFAVACGQGALEIIELQLAGKKPMSAKEFLNGYNKIIGAILK
jgi:methionyl-tRNA formyltransferase